MDLKQRIVYAAGALLCIGMLAVLALLVGVVNAVLGAP